MASTLGAAAVQIIAETDEFDDELRTALGAAADEAAARVGRSLRAIRTQAEQTGRRLGEALGDGAQAAGDQIENMGRLARQAESALNDLDADALDRIGSEASAAALELENLASAARRGEGAFAGMDADQLINIGREAQSAADDMRRLQSQTEDASNELRNFTGEENVRRLAEELRQAQREANRLGRTRLQNLARDARNTGAAIFNAFRGAAAASRRSLDGIDNANFRRLVLKATVAAAAIRSAFRRAGDDVDFSRLGNGLRTVVSAGAGIALLTSKIASLVSVVTTLGAAVAPSAEIIAGLPAALFLTAGAVATLKVGLSGVGDAFKAAVGGDAKAFEESLKKLAPSAQAVAKEVRALKPAFDGLKKSVQGALFKPLQGELTAVAKNLGGPLKAGMTATAAQFGRLAKDVTRFGASASAVSLVRGVFATLKKEIGGIKSGTITGLLKAISKFTTSTLPGFSGLGGFLDRGVQGLTNFLNQAAKGGQALAWLETGKAAVGQLVAILGNLASTAGSVFTAIRAAGGGTLQSFENLTAGLREFAASAQGQTNLTAIFSGVNAIAAQTLPVIKALISGLGALAPTIQALALQVGPILATAIGGIVPALQGVGEGLIPLFQAIGEGVSNLAAGGGLTAFGQALGDLLAAIAPLAPAIGTLLNAGLQSLAPVISVLTPVVRLLADAINFLAQSPAGIVLGPLVAQFLLVFAVTGKVGLALRSLIPVLRLAGQAVLFLGRALISAIVANPVVAAIIAIVALLVLAYFKVKVFRDIVDAIGRALLTAGIAILNFGKSLVAAFQAGGISGLIAKIGSSLGNLGGIIGNALSGLGGFILSGLQAAGSAVISFLASLPGKALSALVTFGPQILSAIGNGLLSVLTFLGTWTIKVLLFFITLPVKIAQAIITFGPTILAAIASGLGQVLFFIANFIIQVLAFFITLPFRILNALLDLALFLKQPFLNAVNAVTSFLSTAIPAVLAFFAALPGRIGAFLASLPGILQRAAVTAWNNFKNATITATLAVISFVRALPGRILSGLSSLGSSLQGAASRAWNAFKSATTSGIARAIAFIRTLPGKAIAALNSFNARMAQVGRDIMNGFIAGVKALASNAIAAITKPISDAVSKVKSLLGSNSPSKVFHKIGGDTIQGFINGTSAKSKAAFAVFKRLIDSVVTQTGRGFVKGLTGTTEKINSTFKKLTDGIVKAFRGQKTKIDNVLIAGLDATNKRLVKLAAKRDAIGDTIKAANAKATEVANAARDFSSLTGVASAIAQATPDTPLDATALAQGLNARLKLLVKFRADVNTLAKKGLADDLISQVVGAGPDQGAALAGALAGATAAQIKDINAVQKAIGKAATGLGKDSADILFDSGKNAGKGFLAGLKSQQGEIVKLMTTIAQTVAKTVKKTLKISSPSRVLSDLGVDTLRGFIAGLAKLTPAVARAVADAVDARGLKADQGGDLAAGLGSALAAGAAAQVGDVAAAQKALGDAASGLGTAGAAVLFDAGKAAGQGFVAGLQSQQAELIKLITVLAQAVTDTVKRTLQISSPSKVLDGLGASTLQGYIAGVDRLAPAVERAVERAVSARGIEVPDLGAAASAINAARFAELAAARTAQQASTAAARATRSGDRAGSVLSNRTTTRTVEVNAPITITMPNADPAATGRAISEAIAARVNR